MADLIKPQNITVKDRDGNEHSFVISRLPRADGQAPG